MQCRFRTNDDSTQNKIEEDWGSLMWLASKELTNSNITVGEVHIKPGKSNPRHCHDSCEEVLYLLTGQLNHTFGDESVVMNPGDTIVIPQGMMHNAENIGNQNAVMIVSFSSGTRDFRKENTTQ